jgi:hypothetical protein
MKKIISISIFVLSTLLAGCNKMGNDSPQETEGKDCVVSFNPVGEISVSESPLTKATPTEDIYCVQVYQGTAPFAMGFFDNLESMKLYLKQGSTYRIIVSMIKNCKTLLGSRYNVTQASICNGGYAGDVFDFRIFSDCSSSTKRYVSDPYTVYFAEYYYPLNRYQYNFKKQFEYYYRASATSLTIFSNDMTASYPYLPYIEKAIINSQKYPTCDGWFYGEAVDYSPTGEYETLDLNFKRVGFKLKYELKGVTDGEVTVKVYNDTRTFIENTTTTSTYSSDEQFIAFYDAHSAWQYADDYSENLTLAVTWKRSIGVTQDLGTKVIQVKRNCLNNLKITLGSDDRSGTVNIDTESEDSMGSSTSEHIVS